jgi:peptide/nickel transport system permease protein
MTVSDTITSRRMSRRPKGSSVFAWLCGAYLVAVGLIAVAAPLIRPYDSAEIDFASLWAGPSGDHLLGTDQLGRDLLSRLMMGALPSLGGPLAVLAIATVLGVVLGVTAAWFGGWLDMVLSRLTDVMLAFPGLLFVVLVISVFGKGPYTAIIALGLAFAPVIARFTRSLAQRELSLPYIDAYRVQGLGSFVICVRRVLPNLAPALLGYLVVLFGDALMSLASLSFLGFGGQPPSSEWGLMVQEGQAGIIQGHDAPTLLPGIAIASVVLAVNIVGVRVADRLTAKAG